jgi:hypothetical protein
VKFEKNTKMAVYRFRVTLEDCEDLIRIIEIKSVQSFEDLHNAIQQAVGFDNAHSASFFMSDDLWIKGEEITLREDDSKGQPLMKNSRLAKYIIDPHQKLIYIFDFKEQWSFLIELTGILLNETKGATYPLLSKTVGAAPKQYDNKKTIGAVPSDDFDFINQTMFEKELADDIQEKDDEGETIASEADGDADSDDDETPGAFADGPEYHEE